MQMNLTHYATFTIFTVTMFIIVGSCSMWHSNQHCALYITKNTAESRSLIKGISQYVEMQGTVDELDVISFYKPTALNLNHELFCLLDAIIDDTILFTKFDEFYTSTKQSNQLQKKSISIFAFANGTGSIDALICNLTIYDEFYIEFTTCVDNVGYLNRFQKQNNYEKQYNLLS
eukprot:166589_1